MEKQREIKRVREAEEHRAEGTTRNVRETQAQGSLCSTAAPPTYHSQLELSLSGWLFQQAPRQRIQLH